MPAQPEREGPVPDAERSPAAVDAAPAAHVAPVAARALSLQRLAGNRAAARLLQRDVVAMDPLTVTPSLRPVEQAIGGLDRLRGQGVSTTGISIAYDDETLRRNSPQGGQTLPFGAGGGWDAQAILRALGQYDTLAWTDSDPLRCVQAVALASRVVDGPQAVGAFIGATILDGMMTRPLGPRERTAIEVLRYVRSRIADRRATFGDLIGVQEALHDLFYDDVSGTPEREILARVAPVFDLGRSAEARATWLASPEDVLAEARRLQPGEQLLLNTWQVIFNEAFDQLSDQGIEIAEGRSTVVNIGGRRVRIRRINTDAKPPHTAIDPNRDRKHGHQLLIINDTAVGGLRLYEPEVTETGVHLENLTAAGLARYFRDLPDVGIYHYMQILGKLTRSSLGSGAWPS